MLGMARCGRRGKFGNGKLRHGGFGQGEARQVRHGEFRRGRALLGWARFVKAGLESQKGVDVEVGRNGRKAVFVFGKQVQSTC